jgi:hypothetical protein
MILNVFVELLVAVINDVNNTFEIVFIIINCFYFQTF